MRSAAAADCHLHHAAHAGDVQRQEGVVSQQVLRQVCGLWGRQSEYAGGEDEENRGPRVDKCTDFGEK
jgi:hypothetical protein